ncbi:hypothetical protein [Nocardia asiatica]|nr:hypothetical protein [Nocardia asiatica]
MNLVLLAAETAESNTVGAVAFTILFLSVVALWAFVVWRMTR